MISLILKAVTADIIGFLWYLETYLFVETPLKIHPHPHSHHSTDDHHHHQISHSAEMCHFSSIRKIFGGKKHPQDEKKEEVHGKEHENEQNAARQNEETSESEDPFAGLSEVAAPAPIQERDDRLSRRRSLEDQYEENREEIRRSPTKETADPFANLSEVASPEPIQDPEGKLSRRDSLEDRLALVRTKSRER